MSAESTAPFECPRVCSRVAHCPVCAAPNRCRLETGEAYKGPCWCEAPTLSGAALRRILADLPEPRCLCADCLEAIARNPEVTWEELAARTCTASPTSPRAGESYLDGGRVVFTARYHLRRGFCCGSGCRHCPFGKAPASPAV